MGNLRGSAHPNYKEDVGYSALHIWMNRNFPRKGCCERCGRTDRPTEYASLGETYTRDRADWLELCRSCHRVVDDSGRKVSRALKGRKQPPISKEARARQAAALRGRKFSDQHRARLSLAAKTSEVAKAAQLQNLLGGSDGDSTDS